MIDIKAIQGQLTTQDEALRARFAEISSKAVLDPTTSALAELMGEGLAAIHERQGDLMMLMLQTST
jgi:hypothetical protein